MHAFELRDRHRQFATVEESPGVHPRRALDLLVELVGRRHGEQSAKCQARSRHNAGFGVRTISNTAAPPRSGRFTRRAAPVDWSHVAGPAFVGGIAGATTYS